MGTNQRSQITMSDDEIAELIERSRTATMATIGPNGTPHLVAMWFAVIDGQIWFETKARAQKTVNLRRDSRITCMIEDGLTYDSLRGVSIEGTGEMSGPTRRKFIEIAAALAEHFPAQDERGRDRR